MISGLFTVLFSCSRPSEDGITPQEVKLELKGGTESNEITYQKNTIHIAFTTNMSWTASSNDNWISIEPANGSAGDISVVATIEENTTSSDRTGKVTIKAGNISKDVSIKQGKKPSDSIITLTATNISYSSFLISASTNSSQTYFWDVVKKSVWDIDGGEMVWDNTIKAYKDAGILSEFIVSGNDQYEYTEQEAQTEYIAFAAFCDKNGVKTGDFFTETFKTDNEHFDDELSPISFSLSNVTQSSFTLTASSSSSQKYFYDIIDKTRWDSAKSAEEFWNTYVANNISESYLVSGTDSYSYTNLQANAEYVAYAAYCYNNGKLKSTIFTKVINLSEYGTGSKPETVVINTNVALTPNDSYTLTATCYDAEYEKLEDATVSWKSSNTSIATVDHNGKVTAIKEGQATITATATKGTAKDVCTVYVVNDFNTPVDMGLSIRWAQCNIGASVPYRQGSCYYWGGLATKSTYQWNWSEVPFNHRSPSFDLSFFKDIMETVIDDKNNLLLFNDTAHLKLGGNWCMPTKEEYDELVHNCTIEKTRLNGVQGLLFKCKKPGYTNKWLFFWCVQTYADDYDVSDDYWSSTISPNRISFPGGDYDESYSSAYALKVEMDEPEYGFVDVCPLRRDNISLVRPVYLTTQPDYFDIKVSNTTYRSFIVTISTNYTGKYYCALVDKSEWDQNGGVALCDAKITYYKEKGLTLPTRNGNVSLQYSDLTMNGDFVFFACLLNEQGERDKCVYRYIWARNMDY